MTKVNVGTEVGTQTVCVGPTLAQRHTPLCLRWWPNRLSAQMAQRRLPTISMVLERYGGTDGPKLHSQYSYDRNPTISLH